MTRTLSHSLHLLSLQKKWHFSLWSAYDSDSDLMPQYLPGKNFRGFAANRMAFVFKTALNARKPGVIVISHINLALIGLLIKAINPKCRTLMIAHGIEVWRPLSLIKKVFLKSCDTIICVSNFTKQQMIERHGIDEARCAVLNNAIDPFIKFPEEFAKPDWLMKRHGINCSSPVVFTLTRLASTEQYKGHDLVIQAIANLKPKFPYIRYVLAGQYDQKEENRIQALIKEWQVGKEVILTGYIEEDEISDYFQMADLFVLPSKKEGFGIVFIEALAYGVPVICGNADGSVDAIAGGLLGTAVNTDNQTELELAIANYLRYPPDDEKRRFLQQQCIAHFNENVYIDKLEKIIWLNGRPD